MRQKEFRFGPLALTNAAANILNPGTTTGGVNATGGVYANERIVLTHIRLVNKTSSSHTASLYIGATGASAAGTEFGFTATTVPANSSLDWYGMVPLDTSDFLTGLADASASITIEGEGYIGIA